MYTLAYESIADNNLNVGAMEALLKKARSNNALKGITGCLIYYDGSFVQLLEGEEQNVLELYGKIKLDGRHSDVHMFSEDDIRAGTFPDREMAYYPIDEIKASRYEFEQFKRNLLLLTDLMRPTNITVKLFWARINFLLGGPPRCQVYTGNNCWPAPTPTLFR
ncbi:hypothetical protein LCGC14_1173420 [marine sediment metagenome]|uniref:BLUF domain-containing protein n=2 Tax=root TaxID=1 RepID=A0A831VUQ8_9FLAO|nr:BLUF domain-containing protein [Pricia antarctica]